MFSKRGKAFAKDVKGYANTILVASIVLLTIGAVIILFSVGDILGDYSIIVKVVAILILLSCFDPYFLGAYLLYGFGEILELQSEQKEILAIIAANGQNGTSSDVQNNSSEELPQL